MGAFLIPFVLLALFLLGFKIWQSSPSATAARLMGDGPLEVGVAMPHQRTFLRLTVIAKMQPTLQAALKEHGGFREAVVHAATAAFRPWADDRDDEAFAALNDDVDQALETALEREIAAIGLGLREVSAFHAEAGEVLERLSNVWIARCVRGGPPGMRTSVNAVEFYLDAASGHGNVHASCSEDPGTVVGHEPSVAILANPKLRVRYTVDGPSGWLHTDTFETLLETGGRRE